MFDLILHYLKTLDLINLSMNVSEKCQKFNWWAERNQISLVAFGHVTLCSRDAQTDLRDAPVMKQLCLKRKTA